MKSQLTIGEIARAAGVPTSTVRYYERAGLLRASGRSRARYRIYTREELNRLKFIRAAQATGFTLADVRQLLRPAPCENVQALIDARLDEVAARLKELRHVQRVLRSSLDLCRAHEETGRCEVIRRLSHTARAKRP